MDWASEAVMCEVVGRAYVWVVGEKDSWKVGVRGCAGGGGDAWRVRSCANLCVYGAAIVY